MPSNDWLIDFNSSNFDLSMFTLCRQTIDWLTLIPQTADTAVTIWWNLQSERNGNNAVEKTRRSAVCVQYRSAVSSRQQRERKRDMCTDFCLSAPMRPTKKARICNQKPPQYCNACLIFQSLCFERFINVSEHEFRGIFGPFYESKQV